MARKSQSPRRGRAEAATIASGNASKRQQQGKQNDSHNVDDSTAQVQVKKGGRPRKSVGSNTDNSTATASKQTGRKTSQRASTAGPKTKQVAGGKRGVKRPRASANVQDEDNEQEEDEEEQAQPARKKQGRSSLKDLPGGSNQQQGKGPKKGQKRSSVRSRPSEASTDRVSDDEEERNDGPSRRQSGPTAQLQAEAPPMPYPHVTTRVRGVKQSTIDAKWKALNASAIATATQTLTLANRPIMQRLAGTEQRRQHASNVLALLQRRISRKLQRGLPFPPPAIAPSTTSVSARQQLRSGGRRRGRRAMSEGGHEAELNFESVIDGTQALERQLEPALHALEVLKKEKSRVETELEKDYKVLQNLEAGARQRAKEQRDRIKKAHALVPDGVALAAMRKVKQEDDVEMKFDGKESVVPPGAIFKDLEDGELKDLALQLGGHVDSIQANLKQAEGLGPQMAASSAALRSVLLRHLSQGEYDEVVLG